MNDMGDERYYCFEKTVLFKLNNGILKYYEPLSGKWLFSEDWSNVFHDKKESFQEIDKEYIAYYIASAIKYYKRSSGRYVRKIYGTRIQYFDELTNEWVNAPAEWLWDNDDMPATKEEQDEIINLNSKKKTR